MCAIYGKELSLCLFICLCQKGYKNCETKINPSNNQIKQFYINQSGHCGDINGYRQTGRQKETNISRPLCVYMYYGLWVIFKG